MSTAMVHGVLGFVFMSAFVAINQGARESMLALLSLAAVIVAIVIVFRLSMRWIIRRAQRRSKQIEEKHIFAILLIVIAMGVVSNLIGASLVFAPFVMGLAVPDGPPLGAALVERARLLTGK